MAMMTEQTLFVCTLDYKTTRCLYVRGALHNVIMNSDDTKTLLCLLPFYDLQSSFDGLDGLDTLSSGGMSSVTNND
jgi:hypothetical protein